MRDDRAPRLADAQRAVAADLGFASWPALVGHVEAARGDRPERRERLVSAALNGRDDVAERLLAHVPAAVFAAGAGRAEGDRAAARHGRRGGRGRAAARLALEGRNIDALVRRTGEASAAVLEALFALSD
jgi:hypothetical protein